MNPLKSVSFPCLVILIALLNLRVSIPANAAELFLQNWMSYKSGSLKISELTIPGTHDSGARYDLQLTLPSSSWPFYQKVTIPGSAKAQDFTIQQQLDNGIRFLDVRCRRVKDSFAIHHGPAFQKIWFGDGVLKPVTEFLKAHPSETIIMSIKEEWNANSNYAFDSILSSYIKQYPPKGGWKGWHTGTSIPTLAESRGRIVLLRRFSSKKIKGIDATDWPGNIFRQTQLRVEDRFNPPTKEEKWNVSKLMLDEAYRYYAITANPAGMYITFTSGNGLPAELNKTTLDKIKKYHNIPYFSNYVNPLLKDYLVNHYGALGILVMDHVDFELAYRAVNTNFPRPSDR
jgi:1-phosphatidylinositol phosphodiesterase